MSARRRGVALIDAIVAAVSLGVALSAIIGLGNQAIGSQQLGEQLQTAANLADEQLNLVLAVGPEDFGKKFSLTGVCEEPFEKFSYKVEITGGVGGSPFRVTATIFFESGGRDRSISIDTQIAPRLGDDPDPVRQPTEVPERVPPS